MRKLIWGGLLGAALVATPAFADDYGKQVMPPAGDTTNLDKPQTFQNDEAIPRGDVNKDIRTDVTKLSMQDRSFVQKAATANMAEVKMARLALDKSSAPEIKQIAQRVLDDHTKAGDELRTVADKEGITLPTDLTADQKRQYTKLSKLSGDRFDREYIKIVSTQHDDAVKVFDRQANEGSDPALKDFAKNTLPALKAHKDMTTDHEGMKGMEKMNRPEDVPLREPMK